MSLTASVNYHVHKTQRQAYHIDAGGVPGKIISPEHQQLDVVLHDVRQGDVLADFATDSVGFAMVPSSITNFSDDQGWAEAYDKELAAFLKDRVGAKEVLVFDHTVRVDDPKSGRKPARNVHSDYSPDGAHKRLVDLLGKETATDWETGHFAFINVWRPVENPINSAPLGFVRPSTVPAKDWILLDLIYPDRVGQILGLVGNPDHEWLYQSKMTPDEVAFFNIYDNKGLPSIAHSALDMIEDLTIQTPRKSIESRTLVRY